MDVKSIDIIQLFTFTFGSIRRTSVVLIQLEEVLTQVTKINSYIELSVICIAVKINTVPTDENH